MTIDVSVSFCLIWSRPAFINFRNKRKSYIQWERYHHFIPKIIIGREQNEDDSCLATNNIVVSFSHCSRSTSSATFFKCFFNAKQNFISYVTQGSLKSLKICYQFLFPLKLSAGEIQYCKLKPNNDICTRCSVIVCIALGSALIVLSLVQFSWRVPYFKTVSADFRYITNMLFTDGKVLRSK